MIPYATHLKALADRDAIEEAIRREADPRGMISRGTVNTADIVKYIRKRHRDSMDEHRREKNAMRMKFDDEKQRLYRIIRGQNEAMESRDEDYCNLRNTQNDLLEEKRAKDKRIEELKEKVETTTDTCTRVTQGSVESLKIAHMQMEHRIVRIKSKHGKELAEVRGWNNTLQERLNIARRLQPVVILHRAQVGTVCEMHDKLVQLKKSKMEELATMNKEKDDLRTRINNQEREIRDLKIVAEADREFLDKTATTLSDKRKALTKAEAEIKSHQREVETLDRYGKAWEDAYHAKEKEYVTLKSEMNTLKAGQRMELIRVKAESESQKTSIDYLKESNDRMDNQLESWKNGHGGSLSVTEPKPKRSDTQPEGYAASLAKALKAANARADALQINVNALQVQKGVLEAQLGDAASAYSPQAQEQVSRLQSENQRLVEAAGRAAMLETQLISQFAEAERMLEERLANRTQELEFNFHQGFENVRELRIQWLSKQRSLEEQRVREMNDEDRQREDDIRRVWKEKEEDIQHKEENLASREAKLARDVKEHNSSDESLSKTKSRADKAEREVAELQVAAKNNANRWDLTERNMNTEIESQRRDGQRHLDLLNEETSQSVEWSRLQDLHSEVQTANSSINSFKYYVTHVGTDSEALSQRLYGADFYESDVRLLQDEGRPMLLAQLQAARRTMERLSNLLAENPNVDVNKALWILTAPRGDEDAAQPADDIFGESSDNQQSKNPRKRSGPPLGAPTYGDHEDNAASNDWGDQTRELSPCGTLSTPEEILNRPRCLPKSRRNSRPAKSVPLEIIDPAIRDQ